MLAQVLSVTQAGVLAVTGLLAGFSGVAVWFGTSWRTEGGLRFCWCGFMFALAPMLITFGIARAMSDSSDTLLWCGFLGSAYLAASFGVCGISWSFQQ